MMKNFLRIIIDVAAILAALTLPWWLACLVLFIFITIFTFPELIISGFVMDILYSSKGSPVFHVPLFFTISSCIFLCLLIYLRTKMMLYN
jgi:hypothetical protein